MDGACDLFKLVLFDNFGHIDVVKIRNNNRKFAVVLDEIMLVLLPYLDGNY